MNVSDSNGAHLTENFIQTNWWVTSFTPVKQRIQANQLNVSIRASFFSNSVHTNLFSALNNKKLTEGNQGDWSCLSIENFTQ